MDATRYLVVIADDYGIGPETSRAILDLAERGVLTGAVLLVNSPYAAEAVRAWRASGIPLELGWHPCLTLDPPSAPTAQVPSLINPANGCFWPLGAFLGRLLLRQIIPAEIELELRAQYQRFLALVGRPPTLVNAHQHISLFGCVGPLLERVLQQGTVPPYVRRVREPWPQLLRVPGARLKRAVLNALGRWQARRLDRLRYPGNDWLAGLTDPRWVTDPAFFVRWLAAVPGRVVELACHPGHYDATLIGRDGKVGDGLLQRRVDELARLSDGSFGQAVRDAGFRLVAPSALPGLPGGCGSCGLTVRRLHESLSPEVDRRLLFVKQVHRRLLSGMPGAGLVARMPLHALGLHSRVRLLWFATALVQAAVTMRGRPDRATLRIASTTCAA